MDKKCTSCGGGMKFGVKKHDGKLKPGTYCSHCGKDKPKEQYGNPSYTTLKQFRSW